MDTKTSSWGMKNNAEKLFGYKDWPEWIKPSQQESWRKKGFVIWDNGTQKIAKLWAYQALEVLKFMNTDSEWKKDEMIIGEPVTRISLNKPVEKPKIGLSNEICLNPEQAQELFVYLQKHEELLQTMAEKDEEDQGKLFAELISLILSWPNKKAE